MARRPSRTMLLDPGHLISFGFGAGLSPFAPGTMGTIVGVAIFLSVVHSSFYSGPVYILLCGILLLLGVYLTARTSDYLQSHDHKAIVLDEIVGFLIAAAWIPLFGFLIRFDSIQEQTFFVSLTFILFRFFDIFKPWPIGWIDRRCGGGFGVMLDDALAGILTFILAPIVVVLVHRL